MKFFNSETRELTLVKDVKNGELVTKKYQFPIFVKGIYIKKAIELGVEVEANEFGVNEELFDKLANFFIEMYGNQFDYEKLTNGIDARKIVPTFLQMLFSVLQGDPKNE